MATLKNKTILITGSSRGIGAAMAKRFAKAGANVVITGKTIEPHPNLDGTIYSVADEVNALGGQALPLQLDVRDEKNIAEVIAKTVNHFGGIDVLINNASAITIKGTEEMTLKRFDLLIGVNVRGTFACSQACIPHLKKSENPHILNIAPPLNMNAKWFKDFLVYTYSKYGMSICTLGMSEEFRADGIAVNSLWPQTTIATDAVRVHFPPEILQASRKPDIMADAAYTVITKNSRDITGNFFTDEEVLRAAGVTDFEHYCLNPEMTTCPDFFLE